MARELSTTQVNLKKYCEANRVYRGVQRTGHGTWPQPAAYARESQYFRCTHSHFMAKNNNLPQFAIITQWVYFHYCLYHYGE